MNNRIVFGAILGALLASAGVATATECFQPLNPPAPQPIPANFTPVGRCYDCFQGVRAAARTFTSKRLGAIRPTAGAGAGATVAYVFGMNFSGGVDTPVPSCFANARVLNGAIGGCSTIDEALYTIKTPVGACASANHWYLDSHN